MRSRRCTVAGSFGLAAILACGADPGDGAPAARSQGAAITAATDDGGDPAVVAIVDVNGRAVCSGTVIDPHVVLTAAHCTTPEILGGATVVFGASLSDPASTAIAIAAARAHPQFDPQTFANDIALVVLSSAAPAAPVALATSAPAVGGPVRLVGWGLTAAGSTDAGTKRQGTATITATDDTTFTVAGAPSQPCDGDSGGPAFVTVAGAEVLAGVTSHGDSACVEHATYTRVDAFLADFVQPAMASLAAGTAPTGATCLFPEQCAGGAAACITAPDDPKVTYCTSACRSSVDCPGGMLCQAAALAPQCRYPVPTPGALGAACTSDADCVDGQCTSAHACGSRCVPDGTSCPSGFACTNLEGIDFFCTAAQPPSSCAMDPSARFDALALLAPAALAAVRLARRRTRAR